MTKPEHLGLRPHCLGGVGGFEPANVILNKSLRKLAKLSLVFGTPRFGGLEASMGGKWLELLSEIAPGLKRVATMFNPEAALVSTYMPSFERQPGHSRSC